MAAQSSPSEQAALSLTLAVVAASPGPLLLLDGALNVIAASTSFSEAFGMAVDAAVGHPLANLGAGEWRAPELHALLASTLTGPAKTEAFEIDLQPAGREVRRLVIHAERLAYLDLANVRILMAVSDVTDARASERAKDEALQQNMVLLQEVRHRVANSLQIIASVLLQNARKTQSDETRDNLKAAHNRVMSVAALERLLSTSEGGKVEAHAYFTSLCDSISVSLIGETDQISHAVEGDDGSVDARVSMSLGLIVTELVINALKYAFPDGRRGKIAVEYGFQGPNWVLCVRDNGVGMQPAASDRTGLGTSIVRALANQLNASVEIAPQSPGTAVSIRHTQIALVKDKDETAATPQIAPPAPSSALVGYSAKE